MNEKRGMDLKSLLAKYQAASNPKDLVELKRRLRSGESTGDVIKDFAVSHLSADENAERKVRMLYRQLRRNNGNIALVGVTYTLEGNEQMGCMTRLGLEEKRGLFVAGRIRAPYLQLERPVPKIPEGEEFDFQIVTSPTVVVRVEGGFDNHYSVVGDPFVRKHEENIGAYGHWFYGDGKKSSSLKPLLEERWALEGFMNTALKADARRTDRREVVRTSTHATLVVGAEVEEFLGRYRFSQKRDESVNLYQVLTRLLTKEGALERYVADKK